MIAQLRRRGRFPMSGTEHRAEIVQAFAGTSVGPYARSVAGRTQPKIESIFRYQAVGSQRLQTA